MSRVGSAPITIPSGVIVEKNGKEVLVNGPKGSLKLTIYPEVDMEIEGDKILVTRKNDQKKSKALHGLTRNLINNMVIGVAQGWSKKLELVGVGFRAQGGGETLTLNVGYSHPVTIKAPQGVNFQVTDNTKITVSGIDKALVGQVAANVKKVKKPDAYKGKGVRYEGEYIRRKAGKSGKAGAAGAK